MPDFCLPITRRQRRRARQNAQMAHIPLHRTFQPLDPVQPLSEYRHRYGRVGEHTWDELLLLRRVMMVGTAGAGKTFEMRAQCKALNGRGQCAFFVTVSSLSRTGFRACLAANDRLRFDEWTACREAAHFFLDSKDEAVNAGDRLRDALRKLGDELGAALARAHIFVSTRPSDLAPEADLRDFREFCPFEGAYRADETPDEVLLSGTKSAPDTAHAERLGHLARSGDFQVLQLTPLSASDQRRFVEAKHPQSADSLDRFLSALTDCGLAPLASYPRDLSVFAMYWLEHGRLGAVLAMLEAYCEHLIGEVRVDAVTSHSTPVAQVRSAVERLAAACVLGGKDGVLSLAELEVAAPGVVSLSFACADVWPHLQPQDHRSILSRTLFDSLVVGQLRLRRDVREYLAGCWLQRAYQGSGARRKIAKHLLAHHVGGDVVLTSRASVTMMLAMRDEMLLVEVLRRNPMLFLSETLVAGFSESARLRTLEACVIRLTQGAELPGRGWGTDSVILRALAFPDALKKLKTLWAEYAEASESVRVLLLWILCEAKWHDCAEQALSAALNAGWGERTQRLAIQALQVANNGSAIARCVDAIFAEATRAQFSDAMVKQAVEWFFPEHLSHTHFLALAPRLALAADDYRYSPNQWAERVVLDAAAVPMLVACVEGIGTLPLDEARAYELPSPDNATLFAFASSLALRCLQAVTAQPVSDEQTVALLSCCTTLLCLNSQDTSSSTDHKNIVQSINAVPVWKYSVFLANGCFGQA
jgi:hypothetical protein